MQHSAPARARPSLAAWLARSPTDGAPQHPGPHRSRPPADVHQPWWKVMCLTGVDYFSTLGYQPGIAFLAAGLLSPLATLVLVALTLLGALPVYRRVAAASPHGEGSIAMLERVLPWWGGKVFVLVLLGFASTDFLITMTLSAADAAAHVVGNPLAPAWLDGHAMAVTLVLLALLGAVFLRGFGEAVSIAVVLAAAYLALNAVVVVDGLVLVATHPSLVTGYAGAVAVAHPSPVGAVAVALLVFPKLALGMSGFETGVAVMPLVRDDPGDTEQEPRGRVRGTRRMLTTAALVMSGYLVTSSLVTTLLVPSAALQPGGGADGRALSYLAHHHLGNVFGSVYDLSTIAILWFAGASAMAGMLNLVPRYLPRYGMAPAWTRATRPLVLVLLALAFVVTLAFRASVTAQAGAYATGVLVLMTSATVAVVLSAHRKGQRRAVVAFSAVGLVFLYTTVANVVERPEGVRIAALFIAGILVTSLVSRSRRAFEVRATSVTLDADAARFVDEAAADGTLVVIAHEPDARPGDPRAVTDASLDAKLGEVRRTAHLPRGEWVVFLEVEVDDASDFESDLVVRGQERGTHRVLTTTASAAPNAVAAVLLELDRRTGVRPDAYFSWTEGSPVANFLRFLLAGRGEMAPTTREVLREARPDPASRPRVHVA